MKFSVIIPTYNRSDLLRQAIDSVLLQTFDDYELIIVDDGSTDNTPDVLDAYRSQIRVITKQHQGQFITRNAGAAVAVGEYLAFLDSDDLMLPWALETYNRVISAIDHPTLLLARMLYFRSNKPYIAQKQTDNTISFVSSRDILSKDSPIGKSFSMIVARKDILSLAGCFGNSMEATVRAEDIDFLLKAGIYGPVAILEQPPTIAYRLHGDNLTVNIPSTIHDGILQILRSERKGIYPGGSSRRFERYAFIGGSVFHWSKKAILNGSPLLGLHLLISGFPMVVSGVCRKLSILVRRRMNIASKRINI
jgi:glycosyltransferase involved in cell wall biosynthesis